MNIIFPRFYNLKKGFWELTDKLNLAALFAQEKKMKASFLQKTCMHPKKNEEEICVYECIHFLCTLEIYHLQIVQKLTV